MGNDVARYNAIVSVNDVGGFYGNSLVLNFNYLVIFWANFYLNMYDRVNNVYLICCFSRE